MTSKYLSLWWRVTQKRNKLGFCLLQGILGDVTVQTFNGTQQKVVNWTMTGYPLTKYDAEILDEVSTSIDEEEHSEASDDVLRGGPILYAGEFSIPAGQQINDTYVDPSGWGKVSWPIAFIRAKYQNTFFFTVWTGHPVHKWIQFGKILAFGWSTDNTLCAKGFAETQREFHRLDRVPAEESRFVVEICGCTEAGWMKFVYVEWKILNIKWDMGTNE